MAPDEKPYRVYRGGRVKGKVPAPRPAPAAPSARGRRTYRGPGAAPNAGGRASGACRLELGLIALVLLAPRRSPGRSRATSPSRAASPTRTSGSTANAQARALAAERLPALALDDDPAARDRQRARGAAARATDTPTRSCSCAPTRRTTGSPTSRSRATCVVPIPGVGNAKINAAYQVGGPALAIKTIHDFTGVPIDHVVIVDFNDFKDLIDADGGITSTCRSRFVSNRFDCPYQTQARCDEWQGWRFQKGTQHMNGERALIYSRIRENQLNPAETDLTRGARQQAVLQAVAGEADLGRDARAAAVRRQLAREAAHDRPLDVAAAGARLGEVPVAPGRTRSTAGSAATSAAAAPARRARTTRRRSRCSSAGRRRSRRPTVRARLPHRPPAAVGG